MIERRRFLAGLAGLVCAPAIVRASSLMAISPLPHEFYEGDPAVEVVERYTYGQEFIRVGLGYAITRRAIDENLYRAHFQPSSFRQERRGRLIEWWPDSA